MRDRFLVTAFLLLVQSTHALILNDKERLKTSDIEGGHGGHHYDLKQLGQNFNAIVTGANQGVGFETTRALAKMGATVHMACRNMDKCNAAATSINSEANVAGRVVPVELDLTSMQSVADFSKAFAKDKTHLDLIVNNAGVNFYTRGKMFTDDGFETTMQTNYLAPFLLVDKLMPLLRKQGDHAGGRVVFLASEAHAPGHHILPEGIRPSADILDGRNYPISKMLTIQLARAIQTREQDNGVTALSVSPGTVDTNIMSSLLHGGNWAENFLYTKSTCLGTWWEGRSFGTPCPMTAEQGADTVVWASTDPSVTLAKEGSTRYFVPGNDEAMPLRLDAKYPVWTDEHRADFWSRSAEWVKKWSQ